MSNFVAVRASVADFLRDQIDLDGDLSPADRLAFATSDAVAPNEWRLSWSGELGGSADQTCSRILQIERRRNDGDEIALEAELGNLIAVLALDVPGRRLQVPLYDWPDAGTVAIGHATLRRINGKGFEPLPDLAARPDHLRYALSLTVEYPAR